MKIGTKISILVVYSLTGLNCTETNLYQPYLEPDIANKIILSGSVCTDDPAQRQFPVRVMFVVDASDHMRSIDTQMRRRYAIEDIIDRYAVSSNYTFSIISFGGDARQLTDGYTKNQSTLTEALAELTFPNLCAGGCRDWFGALSLASSVFTGDVLTTNPGTRSRTRYVFIFVTSGPPDPHLDPAGSCQAVCNQRLLDTVDELVEFGKENGVAEVAFHAVQLDGCPGICVTGQPDPKLCDDVKLCPRNCSGLESCALPKRLCTENYSISCARNDSLCAGMGLGACTSEYVCELDDSINCRDNDLFCQSLGLGSCSSEYLCTSDSATGCTGGNICTHHNAGDCDFVRICTNNPNLECSNDNDCCPRYPCQYPAPGFPPGCNGNQDRLTSDRLVGMTFRGKGEHLRFTQAASLNLRGLDFDTTQGAFVKKAFMVTNLNAKSIEGKNFADSDGDGLSDLEEGCYGEIMAGQCKDLLRCDCDLDIWSLSHPMGTDTDPTKSDTDGDGIGDMLEMQFATVNLDPLRLDLPQACYTLEYPYLDHDMDSLNDCEEKLIGTDHTLFDTDRDGYPDAVELRSGTNYLMADHLQDSDMDGMSNGLEIEIHLDPQASDIAARSGEAYRYKLVDEGLRLVPYSSQPHRQSGVEVIDVSIRSESGAGTLNYYPAGTTSVDGRVRAHPTLSWRDPADGASGREVAVSGSGSYQLYSACSCIKACSTGCEDGQWCDPRIGECQPDPCAKIQCTSLEKCDSASGKCLFDCTKSKCDPGQRCDPLLGKCIIDRCLNRDCETGSACDPESGVCSAPACHGWSCPEGFRLDENMKPAWITVRIDENQLPLSGAWCDGVAGQKPCSTDADCDEGGVCRIRENIVVGMANKNCISFRVKNITLVETLEVDPGFGAGYNNVYVFFAQSPLDNPHAYSIFRATQVQMRFLDGEKIPDWYEIPLKDSDFFAIQEK